MGEVGNGGRILACDTVSSDRKNLRVSSDLYELMAVDSTALSHPWRHSTLQSPCGFEKFHNGIV